MCFPGELVSIFGLGLAICGQGRLGRGGCVKLCGEAKVVCSDKVLGRCQRLLSEVAWSRGRTRSGDGRTSGVKDIAFSLAYTSIADRH